MNNQAACSFLFQSISNFFSCTWKITIWQRVQPPQPPRVYQLRPSIPQGRVYQQLHLRDLIKGAPSVKPWETVSTIWYVSSTIQHFFLKLLMLVIITFFFLGFVFKFISSFLWSSFWHDMDLPKYIFVQTSKILYLYLVKLLKSWPT